MRSIVGAITAAVALLLTGCGAQPTPGTNPPAPTTTVAPPAPRVETPVPVPPATTTTRTPQLVVPPVEQPPANVYYANCSAAKAAGAAPLHRGDPGYRSALDRDGDGVACER